MSIGLLYLFMKLDVIVSIFTVIGITTLVVGLFVAAAGAFIGYEEHSDKNNEDNQHYWNNYKKIVLKILLPILVVSSLFSVFLPTTKEVAFIYIASKITNNDKAKSIPDKVLDILNNKMNEYIKEQIGEKQNDK